MRNYELMVIFAPTVDVSDKTTKALVEKIVGKEATVIEVTVLGKKHMAYKINKFTEGWYVLVKLAGEHVNVHEIEKKVQLGTDVIRYLLTAHKVAKARK